MTLKSVRLFCILLPLLAGQSLPAQPPGTARAAPASVAPGRSFAVAQCSGCHGVDAQHPSPNPEAPSFARIANQEGLTGDTLSTWLRNAHDYPAEMNFELDERQANELVAYFLSLKDPNYRRSPD
jgi:mono/diheme cytochrome c family protein